MGTIYCTEKPVGIDIVPASGWVSKNTTGAVNETFIDFHTMLMLVIWEGANALALAIKEAIMAIFGRSNQDS